MIHTVPGHRSINVGATVWVAGAGFVTGVKDCSWVGSDSLRIGAWPTGRRGFRTGLGHRRDFADLVYRLRIGLERSLHVALFDHAEIFLGDAPLLHDLYSALPLEPDLEYQLTRALYFDARRDTYSVDHVRSETVYVFGLVDSEDAFTRALNRRRDELETSRLGERAAAYADPLPTSRPLLPPSEMLNYISQFVSHSVVNSTSDSALWLLKSMRSLQTWTVDNTAHPIPSIESDVPA
ncbi:hypothetical protein ASD43_04965 [Microbacterium sp. Root553]|nr:hypothetical protein ASD43_04965 [Microbacterium sp. Root553]